MARTIYITEEQKQAIKKSVLNEENGTQKKKCVEQIRSACPYQLQQFLDMPLADLPMELKRGLNPDGALFHSVSNNTTGSNKFIDYLRLNLYAQFGITRGSILNRYIPGIARIACQDLNFYAFDRSIRGPEIMRFSQVLNLIKMKPEIALRNMELDSDLDGLSYEDFMQAFSRVIQNYKREMNASVDNYKAEGESEYRIIRVPDRIVESGYGTVTVLPTAKGREFLDNLSPYTDWCVCNSPYADQEYAQYMANGGAFYVCLRNGFENEQKVKGEGCPLDSYGVSMIAVIIGDDGLPENITTRWNHDMGGENHPNLWNAQQLQQLLNVNFREHFKPRSQEELKRLYLAEGKKKKTKRIPSAMDQVHGHVNSGIMVGITGGGMFEGAEPESDKYTMGMEAGNDSYGHVKEDIDYKSALKAMKERRNPTDDFDFATPMKSIARFMKENGLNVYPYPKVKLNWDEQDGIFIKTGYYLPDEMEIVVFCKDRHPKDILRTFSHEMIHHSQNLDGKNLEFSPEDDVKGNKRLEEIESEAYLKGNIFFRKWTEYMKGRKPHLNESISFEEVNPDDVDLSSFELKNRLNPKFWKDGKLDSRVRMKLLDIADDFIDYLGVDWASYIDITMTGSLANFNWNRKYSDIDLHVIMDFSEVDDRTDFVKKYFNAKRKMWNNEHKIKILGFPVEVYVQDVSEPHNSTGVYSLERNTWVKEPNKESLEGMKNNHEYIKRHVAKYMDRINTLEEKFKDAVGDEYKTAKVMEKAESLFSRIKDERSKKAGEMSNGNIIFKALRRMGYIGKLSKMITKAYDSMSSLA